MLIDFTVENYRSIKGPITLSAIASSRRPPRARSSATTHSAARRIRIAPDEQIAQAFQIPEARLEVLPVLGIFGANASGKSNVLRALDDFLRVVSTGSAVAEIFLEYLHPFALDYESKIAPQSFKLRAVVDNLIYSYSITIDFFRRILSEELERTSVFFLSGGPELFFKRIWRQETKSYEWQLGKIIPNSYREILGGLSSGITLLGFLTTHLDVPALASLKHWLSARMPTSSFDDEQESRQLTINAMKDRHTCGEVVAFLRKFDTGISDLEIYESNSEKNKLYLSSKHNTPVGSFQLRFDEESRGTQHLLGLALKVITGLSLGTVVLEDELGSNIHPNITREIIKLFQSEKTNPKHAQLIFTSHDNTLQRHQLLRRDQIWFTEKRSDGSTNLYPLTDFRPRNDLALDQAYLDGRFGAVPILPATEDFLPQRVVEIVG